MISLFGKKPEPAPTVYTEQTCSSCGAVERRPFEQGDHVYKEQGVRCGKCGSNATIVTAIYGEYPPESDSKKKS
ncbi:hypothetical protein [Nitrososphaera sp.]|uniref:hypothetical protein n=1 Tax=Nitrososphaera sp. TaxID=1971748 RepID=UPI00307E3442